MRFILLGLLLVAGMLFTVPRVYADVPEAEVKCIEPAPMPEPAEGYGGNWGILNAINDLSNIAPGYKVSSYTDSSLPLGVYVVNPEPQDIKVLVYYKNLQRDVDIESRDNLYYQPPAGADQWLSICYLTEVAEPRWEQPTQGVIVPAGTKLLVPVVISIPDNATLDKPIYLALEFAEVQDDMLQFRQDALFLLVPAPKSSSPVIYMAFAGTLCVIVIGVYLFTLKRRRAR